MKLKRQGKGKAMPAGCLPGRKPVKIIWFSFLLNQQFCLPRIRRKLSSSLQANGYFNSVFLGCKERKHFEM